MSVKIAIHGVEIECPDKIHLEALVKRMSPSQAFTLSRYQKLPKHWPGHTNIPEYCIYMGSDEVLFDNRPPESVDYYRYEETNNREYSTAIVFGNEPGDYRSGWPELAARRDCYREHMHREFKCGFLTVDDLVKVGMAALGVEKSGSDTIRPMRGSFRLGMDDEIMEALAGDFAAVGNDMRKAMDEMAKAVGIPASLMKGEKE